MRRKDSQNHSYSFKIILLDDDSRLVKSVEAFLFRRGYKVSGFTEPLEAVKQISREHFDLLILDFIMAPANGDKIVEMIRSFNKELYILLLTGHKDLAPPLETIKALDIQGYCEKSDRFDQLLLLVESAFKSITQMQTIQRFRDGLHNILQIVPKIYQLQPIGSILEQILLGIVTLADSDSAFILVDDFTSPNHPNFIFKGIGSYSIHPEDFLDELGPVLMEQIGKARSNKHLARMDKGVIFPLINHDKNTLGVIYVEFDSNPEEIRFIEVYANQVALSLNNAFLHSLVNIKNDELNKTYDELRSRYIDTIQVLRLTVDAKDVYTRGHSDRVAYYAVKIGQYFKLSEKELELLRIGGTFHDIGKISTTDDILLKTGYLEEKEYDEIKKHPLKGAHILSAVSMFKEVVPLVRCHHERIDGKGYPHQLTGEDIPFLARILSIADAFDAMTSDRLYRSRLNLDEAKNQLVLGAGTQFDAVVVQAFLKILDDFGQIEAEIAPSFDEVNYA